jgi:hypothetical protein
LLGHWRIVAEICCAAAIVLTRISRKSGDHGHLLTFNRSIATYRRMIDAF